MSVLETELDSLIQFMNDLNDAEYNRIFTFNGTEINLNFNELVKLYYEVDLTKKPKKYSRVKVKNNVNMDQIDHFRDVVNEFIKYLANENLNVSILENTK